MCSHAKDGARAGCGRQAACLEGKDCGRPGARAPPAALVAWCSGVGRRCERVAPGQAQRRGQPPQARARAKFAEHDDVMPPGRSVSSLARSKWRAERSPRSRKERGPADGGDDGVVSTPHALDVFRSQTTAYNGQPSAGLRGGFVRVTDVHPFKCSTGHLVTYIKDTLTPGASSFCIPSPAELALVELRAARAALPVQQMYGTALMQCKVQ